MDDEVLDGVGVGVKLIGVLLLVLLEGDLGVLLVDGDDGSGDRIGCFRSVGYIFMLVVIL